MTIWITLQETLILLFHEALLSNHNSLQLIQCNPLHFIHLLKAIISHFKQSQIGHEGPIKHTPFGSVTTVVTHDQFFNVIVKELILFTQHYSLAHWFIIHPFSIKHSLASSVILNASSPSLSFTPLAFILNHSNIRVVPHAIAHIHFPIAESLISHSVLTVIQHAPTIGFIVKHITFPSLSLIIQIQHPIVFNPTYLLSIHSQQTT